MATHSMLGTVTLQGMVATAPPQDVTFTFIPDGGGAPFSRILPIDSTGAFSITRIPPGAYTVHVSCPKYLAVNLHVDLSGISASGINMTLRAGDSNGDNEIDILDFGILTNSLGTNNPESDFNEDGQVDVADFALLSKNFGSKGDR